MMINPLLEKQVKLTIQAVENAFQGLLHKIKTHGFQTKNYHVRIIFFLDSQTPLSAQKQGKYIKYACVVSLWPYSRNLGFWKNATYNAKNMDIKNGATTTTTTITPIGFVAAPHHPVFSAPGSKSSKPPMLKRGSPTPEARTGMGPSKPLGFPKGGSFVGCCWVMMICLAACFFLTHVLIVWKGLFCF